MPRYVVTKLAGREISGVRNPGAGKVIELTEKQARHPLRQKHIEVPQKSKPKPSETDVVTEK